MADFTTPPVFGAPLELLHLNFTTFLVTRVLRLPCCVECFRWQVQLCS